METRDPREFWRRLSILTERDAVHKYRRSITEQRDLAREHAKQRQIEAAETLLQSVE